MTTTQVWRRETVRRTLRYVDVVSIADKTGTVVIEGYVVDEDGEYIGPHPVKLSPREWKNVIAMVKRTGRS